LTHNENVVFVFLLEWIIFEANERFSAKFCTVLPILQFVL